MPLSSFPIVTIADHIAAGVTVTSYCSMGRHSHVLDLQALMKERGPDAVLDYDFKRSLICPECGASGGGLRIDITPG